MKKMNQILTGQQLTLLKAISIVLASLLLHGCPNGTNGSNGTGPFGRYTYNDAMRDADEETKTQLREACGATVYSVECQHAINLTKIANHSTTGPGSRQGDTCHDCHPDGDNGYVSVISTPPKNMKEKEEEAFKAYEAAGGDPMAFKQALCYLKKKQGSPMRMTSGEKYQMNPCFLSIQNNTKSHVYNRSKGGVAHTVSLIRVNLCEGTVKKSISALGHGNTSGRVPQCAGEEICPKGSDKTPHGFSMLGGKHSTDYATKAGWGPGIQMHGLEKFNANNVAKSGPTSAEKARGVVFHRAKTTDGFYCGNAKDSAGNPICTGRTAGCTGVTNDMWNEYKHLMTKRPAGNGASVGELHYNFSKYEQKKGENYCGSN